MRALGRLTLVGVLLGVSGVAAAKTAPSGIGMSLDTGLATLFWRASPPSTSTRAIGTPTEGPLLATFAWRTSSGLQGKLFTFGCDFDYSPISLVEWRLRGGVAPRLGRVQPFLELVAGAGMAFTPADDRLGVLGLAYVGAEAGAKIFVSRYVDIGVGGERTIVSTKDLWGAFLTVGLSGPM